jgi:hypothetical protein
MSVLLVASFFATTIAMSGVSRASAQIDSALSDVVPAESVLYTEIELDQTSEQWATTYELLDRAGLSNLAQDQVGMSPEQVGQMAETFQFTGKAAMVFTSPEAFTTEAIDDFSNEAADMTADPSEIGSSDVPEGFVVVFQPEDPQALYEQFQTMVAEEAETAGVTAETVVYNGTTIDFWTANDGTTEPTATALINDTVVLAVRPDDIEPIIDTVNGDVEALSANTNFTTILGAFDGPSLNFGYMNGDVIADQAAAEDPEVAVFTKNFSAYVGWNVFADEQGFHFDTVTVPAEGAELGTATAFDPTFAEKFPADSLLFMNGSNLAGTGIFDLFGFALQASFAETDSTIDVTPVATPTVDDVYAQLEAQLGFNLKTDLFDQLDGEFGVALNVDQIMSDEPVTDFVFVSEVADETTVSDVTSKITFIVNSAMEGEATLSEREVTGGTVTSIALDASTTGGFPVTLEYGVVGGELLIGVNNGIDSYLDGASAPLAEDATFQQTMAALPQEDIVGIQYLNLQKLLPIIEDAATSMSGSTATLDNDVACGDYATQEEAQTAYDADTTGLWNLDLDYDGQACEDFFDMGATAEASPVSYTEQLNLLSIGTVSYTDGDMYRSSTILLIGE